MVLCEDTECSVCLLPYTRLERIPRLLHCRHTFCQSCLETLSQSRAGLITVCCPLCRRVTCVRRSLGLTGALWVDSTLWDQIVEDDREEDKYQLKQDGALVGLVQDKQESSCLSARSSRTKLKFPAFLRRFSLSRQHQEQIIPGSNVEIKSWRRLSTADSF
ncbi:hypothetical protein NQD34_002239 [Periophthalmus magnuspinnatus]|uniref:uncharacterized protein im:7152348 n=1 Tax=Periophthalmus magnuspinnatus TaxID=409849 RepID=UPI00145B55B6|nr:uncharacterized protein im:7152348 [Periophthalmus magnuspinnatus]KAJ0032158.1 hypothetical protein NQD34_002239 [Periophthalmus magnuspinnatus]